MSASLLKIIPKYIRKERLNKMRCVCDNCKEHRQKYLDFDMLYGWIKQSMDAIETMAVNPEFNNTYPIKHIFGKSEYYNDGISIEDAFKVVEKDLTSMKKVYDKIKKDENAKPYHSDAKTMMTEIVKRVLEKFVYEIENLKKQIGE
tara:strand:+ start:613 stop:1050 length:438 start_codon:yes stop_codon:yes gene_type:complete